MKARNPTATHATDIAASLSPRERDDQGGATPSQTRTTSHHQFCDSGTKETACYVLPYLQDTLATDSANSHSSVIYGKQTPLAHHSLDNPSSAPNPYERVGALAAHGAQLLTSTVTSLFSMAPGAVLPLSKK